METQWILVNYEAILCYSQAIICVNNIWDVFGISMSTSRQIFNIVYTVIPSRAVKLSVHIKAAQ